MAKRAKLSFEYVGQNFYIRPNYIVSMPDFALPFEGHSQRFRDNMKHLKANAHLGDISQKADKKLRNAINWLLACAKDKRVFHKLKNSWFTFKVNFITLTLPDTDTPVLEKDFKVNLLNPWLTYMRSYFGLKNYVWKMEFQANGKLHLHITTDTFLHYEKIRSSWNKLLAKNGYLLRFAREFGHLNPNSTDVHSVHKVKNLAGYLAKYMAKNDETRRKVKGRIWGCNYELSRANTTKVFIPRDELLSATRSLFTKEIEYEDIIGPSTEFAPGKKLGEIFFIKMHHWYTTIKGEIRAAFWETIAGLQNLYHSSGLFPASENLVI